MVNPVSVTNVVLTFPGASDSGRTVQGTATVIARSNFGPLGSIYTRVVEYC
jgi:hypothetical protein